MYSFITMKKTIDLAKPKSGAPINYPSFTEKTPLQKCTKKHFTDQIE